jgi:hypothetical protein
MTYPIFNKCPAEYRPLVEAAIARGAANSKMLKASVVTPEATAVKPVAAAVKPEDQIVVSLTLRRKQYALVGSWRCGKRPKYGRAKGNS